MSSVVFKIFVADVKYSQAKKGPRKAVIA